MTVGERIKQRREELGLSQEELAKKMGYASKSAVSRTENAGDKVGTNRIVQFADALGVTPSYLMGWEDEPENDWYHSDSQESYYLDAETTRIAEQIHHNPELALLFDAAKDVSAEDLKTVHALLLSLKRRERFDD